MASAPSFRLLTTFFITVPLIIFAAVLILSASYSNRRIADDLGNEIIERTTEQVMDAIGAYLVDTVRISELYTRRLRSGMLPADDLRAWRATMLDDLLTSPHVASICFANPRGDATWLLWHGEQLEWGIVDSDEDHRAVEYIVDHGGTPAQQPLRTYRYVAADRPWHQLAMSHDGPTWTPVYFWFGEQGSGSESGSGYTRRVHDASGELLGVLVIDITLSSLSEHLRTLRAAQPGHVFLVDEEGMIVASGKGPVTTPSGDRLALADSPDPAAQAAASLLDGEGDGDVTSMHTLTIDNQLARAGRTRVQRTNGPDWNLIVVLPESAFLGEVARVQQRLLLLGVGALGAAVLLGVIVSRRMTEPLMMIRNYVRHVGRGDFRSRLHLHAARELNDVSTDLNRMADDLSHLVAMRRGMEMAMEVQQTLLPRDHPQVAGLDIAGRSWYCDETGGDYFDYLQPPLSRTGTMTIAVGDVVGHGIAAALLMATARAALRTAAETETRNGTDLGGLLGRINTVLTQGDQTRFMTMVLLRINPRDRAVQWACAGHDPAMLYRPDTDAFDELKAGDIPLGVLDTATYREFTATSIAPGSVLVIGTDGVWESRNEQGEQFGKDRMLDIVRAYALRPANETLRAIENAVTVFRGGRALRDDLTLVVVKFLDDSAAGNTNQNEAR